MAMEISGGYGLYGAGYAQQMKKIFYEDSKKSVEKCTTNTDKVDREIKNLKEKQRQLKQEIEASSKDKDKVRKLEKQLAQVESELNQKDNDTYRRQKAQI